MTASTENIRFDWYGFAVSVTYCPDWCAAFKEVQGQTLYHVEIESGDSRPLPTGKTGYQSLFVGAAVIEAWGGVAAYARGALNLAWYAQDEPEEPEQFSLF
jgi:hypothetical protein